MHEKTNSKDFSYHSDKSKIGKELMANSMASIKMVRSVYAWRCKKKGNRKVAE